ncbi:MAG: hypothetical protein WCA07_01915 [Gloeobacterales cyanobacterium]
MVSFKNSLYVDIAQGHPEEPSLSLLKFSLSALPGAILGILLTFPRQSTIKQPKEHIEMVQSKEPMETEQSKEQLGQLRERLEQLNERISIEKEQLSGIEKNRRRILIQGGLLFLFLITFSVIYSLRVSYVNRAITNFNQLLAISSPHLTPDERLKQISLFAQVRNRDDYFKIVTDLSTACEQNKLKVPEFSVW